MNATTPLLALENLSLSFAERQVLDNVSFSVAKGETLGIVGESGSGKSLTVLSLLGLLPKGAQRTGGTALFQQKDGRNVDLFALKERQLQAVRGNEIAMIFQEPMTSLNPVLTCGYQVAEALILHQKLSTKQAKARTIELFEEVKLPRPASLFDAYPHQISGGQKQRVMIAMALACEPSLLLADEPTTALDVTVQQTILELLRHLQQSRGLSLIFISHDLGVIAEIAEKVAVMYQGKIIETGSVKDIFSHPKQSYTQALLASRPPLDQIIERLPVSIKGSDFELTPVHNLSDEALSKRWNELYSQPPFIQVKDLEVYFQLSGGYFWQKKNRLHALQSISFDIYKGETLGLVGESGSGKTTLGRTMLRLLEPSAGKVIFDGQPVLDLAPSDLRVLRRRMQIIFQDPYGSLPPHRTVAQILVEPMEIHHLEGNKSGRMRRVEELLHQVGLHTEHLYRYPHEFSGGQRQRICIARALAVRPEFIVCDESVSALDVSVQAQILNLLKDLQRDLGLTYLFISHDLSVIRFMADRILVMQNGQLVESGNALTLFRQPQQAYTRQLLDAIPQVR